MKILIFTRLEIKRKTKYRKNLFFTQVFQCTAYHTTWCLSRILEDKILRLKHPPVWRNRNCEQKHSIVRRISFLIPSLVQSWFATTGQKNFEICYIFVEFIFSHYFFILDYFRSKYLAWDRNDEDKRICGLVVVMCLVCTLRTQHYVSYTQLTRNNLLCPKHVCSSIKRTCMKKTPHMLLLLHTTHFNILGTVKHDFQMDNWWKHNALCPLRFLHISSWKGWISNVKESYSFIIYNTMYTALHSTQWSKFLLAVTKYKNPTQI
jgi:hypothetical protein